MSNQSCKIRNKKQSDQLAIVAYAGATITKVNKTRRVCTFRKHTSAEHAKFLAGVSDSSQLASPDGYAAL